MPLLAAAALYVTIDIQRRMPMLALPARQFIAESSAVRQGTALHRLDLFTITLPQDFRLLRKAEEKALFYSPAGDMRLRIDYAPPRATVPGRPFLQAVAKLLGYGSNCDAAALAVRSRFGLIPALIKSAMLKRYEPDTVQTFCVSSGPFTGIMLRGEQSRPGEGGTESMPDQVAEILLRDAGRNLVIRVMLASRLPLNDKYLERLVTGIR
jgi:hypothetical protein